MRKLRFRAVGALAVVATVAAVFVFTQAPANAATIIYTCTGATNDTGGYTDTWGGPQYISSAGVLNTLAGLNLGISATPQVEIKINATNVPSGVAAGSGAFGVGFDFSASLPESLITAASGLGLSQITVQNAAFDINVVGATPSTITGGFATRTVALSPTPVTVSQPVSGSVTPTGAAGENILYKPGSAHLSLVLNLQIVLLHIQTLTLTCTPSDSVIAATAITGGTASTTTPPTTVATTTTPPVTTTTPPVTTTTPPVTTTTTTPPTTTTTTPAGTTTLVTTTTTTTPATTTTVAPTTTGTPPEPGSDAVIVNVSGSYAYTNSGNVSGAGFSIASDGFGVSSVTGAGDLTGNPSGTAHVAVQVSRFLFWSFGTITVSDSSAGIPNLQAVVFFGPAPSLSGQSTTLTGSWFTFDNFQFKPFTITATITDAG